MRYMVRKSVIDVVGKIWMPAIVCGQRIVLTEFDVETLRGEAAFQSGGESREITREIVEMWLSMHAGDFSSIIDFSASIEDGDRTIDIPWESEEGEMQYIDAMTAGEE